MPVQLDDGPIARYQRWVALGTPSVADRSSYSPMNFGGRYTSTFTPNQGPDSMLERFKELGPNAMEILSKTGSVLKNVSMAMLDSVNFFERDISDKDRLARIATLATFFIPLGATAQIAGRTGLAVSRAGRIALTATQEAGIGAGISAMHGGSITAGAGIGGSVGGLLEAALGGRFARAQRAVRAKPVVEAFRDPKRVLSRVSNPFEDEGLPYVIVSSSKYGDAIDIDKQVIEQLAINMHRQRRLGKFLKMQGDPAMPVLGQTTKGVNLPEAGYLIPGMTEAEGINLARALGQRKIITPRGLIDVQASTIRRMRKGATKLNDEVIHTVDNYTEVTLPGASRPTRVSFQFGEPLPLEPRNFETVGSAAVKSLVARPDSKLDRATKFFNQPVKTKILDKYAHMVRPVAKLEHIEELAGMMTDPANPLPSQLVQLAKSAWTATAESAIKFRLPRWHGRGVSNASAGKALTEVLSGDGITSGILATEFEDFSAFMIAKRMKFLVEDEGHSYSLPFSAKLNRKITMADIEDTIKSAPSRFAKTFDELNEWRNTMLREFLGESGVMPKATIEKIISNNPVYAPLRTQLDEFVERISTADNIFTVREPVGIIGVGGKELLLQDPLDVMVKEVFVFSQLAHQQQAVSSFVNMVQRMGPHGVGIARKLEGRPAEIQHAGKRFVDSLRESDEALANLYAKYADELDLMTAPNAFMQGGYVSTFDKAGKRQWWKVEDKGVWEAFKFLAPNEVSNFIKMASKPSQWLRAGATLSLEFMSRNPVRDIAFAFVTKGAGIRSFAKGFYSLFKRGDNWFNVWREAGGPGSELVGGDLQTLGREAAAYIEAGGRVTNIITHPIQGLQIVSAKLEQSTRLGLFRKTVDEALDAGVPTEDAIRLGVLESKRGTVDFSMHGNALQNMRLLTAFWNASIQGTDTFVRALVKDPVKVGSRALLGITLPSVGLYLLNRKDPEYQNLPDWEKKLFWHLKLPGVPVVGDSWIRIPKPFEPGIIFGSLPERLLKTIDEADPSELDEFAGEWIRDTAREFMPIPTVMQPLVEMLVNRNFFRGTPLITRGQEDVALKYRRTKGTSETAKLLVQSLGLDKLGLDPIKLDHGFRSWTGGLGRLGTDITDRIIEATTSIPPTPASNVHDIPLIRGFVSRFPENSQSIEDFYRHADEVREASRTLHELERSMQTADLADWMVQRAGLLAASPVVNSMVDNLNAIRQQQQMVLDAPNMDKDTKRELLNVLNQTIYDMTTTLVPILDRLEDSFASNNR